MHARATLSAPRALVPRPTRNSYTQRIDFAKKVVFFLFRWFQRPDTDAKTCFPKYIFLINTVSILPFET